MTYLSNKAKRKFILLCETHAKLSLLSSLSTLPFLGNNEQGKKKKRCEKQSKKLFDLRAVTMNFSPLCRCLCVFLGKNENCVEFMEMNRHIYYGRGHAERGDVLSLVTKAFISQIYLPISVRGT